MANEVFSALEIFTQAQSEALNRVERMNLIQRLWNLSKVAAVAGLVAKHPVEEVLQKYESEIPIIWNQLLGRKANISMLGQKHSKLAQ